MVNQSALSCVPNTVTAGNAESGSASMISSWKGLCANWEQETADAVGKAACNYAIQWNNAVIPEIDAKIERFQAEYEDKKAQYDTVNKQYKAAARAIVDAQNDMNACMDYPKHEGKGLISNDASGVIPEKVIVDHYGYQKAKEREAAAKADVSRYKGQVDNWKRQMDSAQSKVSQAKSEKKTLMTKIEQFILGVYELNLMNESVPFLLELKNSSIDLSAQTKQILFGRLFFIQNNYRKQFEQFEERLKSAGDSYTHSFESTPESLTYSAKRKVKAKKFKGELSVILESKSKAAANLSYLSKNEFFISSKKIEETQNKVQPLFKNYELKIDRNNFIIELHKIYENDAIKDETEQVLSRCDEYVNEYITLLDEFHANGASNSKIKVFFGKIKNWHLAHWKKLWYKITSIAVAVILFLMLLLGIFAGVAAIDTANRFHNSFKTWTVLTKSGTNEIISAEKRFLISKSKFLYVSVKSMSETGVKVLSGEYQDMYKTEPDRFTPITSEMDISIKEKLKDLMLPKGTTLYAFLSLREESGNALSQKSVHDLTGIFEITIKDDGSISEIKDLSGCGFLIYY